MREPRAAGRTKYPLSKMVRLAADSITDFSAAPLRIATWLGAVNFFFCLLMLGYVVVASLSGTRCRAGPRCLPACCSSARAAAAPRDCWVRPGRLYATVQGRPAYFVGYDSAEDSAPVNEIGMPTTTSARHPSPPQSPVWDGSLLGVVGRRNGTAPSHWPKRRPARAAGRGCRPRRTSTRATRERVERAHLDADAAVHAEREVDGEPVEHVALPPTAARGPPPLPSASRCRCTSPGIARTQHADGAILLEKPITPRERGGERGSRPRIPRVGGTPGGVQGAGVPPGGAPWTRLQRRLGDLPGSTAPAAARPPGSPARSPCAADAPRTPAPGAGSPVRDARGSQSRTSHAPRVRARPRPGTPRR